MPDLIENHAAAKEWVKSALSEFSGPAAFGRFASSVIWSDARGPDGEQLVPADPVALAASINSNGLRLLMRHDPGFPVGKVLAAEVFTPEDGNTFVAAILGFYEGAQLSFNDLGLSTAVDNSLPISLPPFPEVCWINIATDPREVEQAWVDRLIKTAPLPVEYIELSHNAAESTSELIVVGLLFITLVWNPFVKTFAQEAGKDAYAGVRNWLRQVLEGLADHQSPILEIQSNHGDCQISFIFRGKDVKRHCSAHDALPGAANQATKLLKNLKDSNLEPVVITYEFHQKDDIWFPSFVELRDGRLITDNITLIAVERLPSGLSLGLSRGEDKVMLPTARISG
jgi:hypothetical protein